LASRFRLLPAIYPFRYYAVDGGLISVCRPSAVSPKTVSSEREFQQGD
jgi:hypothetical protein